MAASASTESNEIQNQCKNPLCGVEKLEYEIFRYSSFSISYYPENILVDCPTDQTSRWSAQTNNPPQFLTLKLKRPAIVKKIKFGKFEKSHVCNLKKFRVYGGLEEQHMVLLLESGLKNDSIPEVFNLRSRTESGKEHLPTLYIQIVPMLSWGPSFNFSIWYIELLGQDDPMFTNSSLANYNELREVQIIKLCLKHFRQQGYEGAFKALQEQTQVILEHPLVSELHQCLVKDGDFNKAERFVIECINEGLMDEYLNKQDYKHFWRLQQTQSGFEPGTRGGHQLVMDAKKRLVYLFGGWDGYRDVSDMWVFDIESNSWSLLLEDSELYNGPTPRSCHKMVYDPISENIFMLGRYLEYTNRTEESLKSDFFLFDTRSRSWLQICDDTSQVGGPQLLYDHQMCIDVEKRTIYVFGGKILTAHSPPNAMSTSDTEYSGLFAYHIDTNTWTQVLVDCYHPTAANEEVISIKSRVTHCMVFHNRHRKLYIYGGQRGKEDLDEFISYDVDTQAVSTLSRDQNVSEVRNKPSPGHTLRATIDCDRDEIYVFSSLSKQKDRRDIEQSGSCNSFWVYSLSTYKWSRIYFYRHSEGESSIVRKDSTTAEPLPRYAHQFVYDNVAKVHYLFGGNPGRCVNSELRLDDFWVLLLERPKRAEILQQCRFLIRKQHYKEIAKVNPIKAMQFLREDLSEVIDHSNAEELKKFHKLALLLFMPEDTAAYEHSMFSTPPIGYATDAITNAAASGEVKNMSPANSVVESSKSCSSTSVSSLCDNNALATIKSATKSSRSFQHHSFSTVKCQRTYLFNKIVQLMPTNMVQPERNLSDFVTL